MSREQITRLYDTVFDRAPDGEGLSFWINSMAAGTPLDTLADLFITAPEFAATYGQPDNLSFVQEMYRNVLDRPGEAEGMAFWTGALERGAADRSAVVLAFSESPEHVARMAAAQSQPVPATPAPVPAPVQDQPAAPPQQTPPATQYSGALAPAPAGYRVVLADDFSNGYNKAHWGDPFPLPWPSGPSSNGAYIWDPNDVNVRNGEMQVTMTHHADGHWSTTGFNSFKAGIGITYGQVEFDAKVESGQGTAGGILMWPSDDTFPPEIDIIETPNNTSLFSLHFGNGDEGTWSTQNKSLDPSQWHHYTMNWLPSGITISVDGQVQAQWTSNIPNVSMGFGALGFVGSAYDSWMGGAPDSTTPSLVTLHLDNVVMSQWSGIA